MRPCLPEFKGLAACGHLFGSPRPSGQHLHHFCLDLKDHNELAPLSCPEMGIDAVGVTETDGVGVSVSCVARSPPVASLFFSLSSVFAPFCSAKATHPVSLTQGLEEEPGGFSDCRPVSPLSPQE